MDDSDDPLRNGQIFQRGALTALRSPVPIMAPEVVRPSARYGDANEIVDPPNRETTSTVATTSSKLSIQASTLNADETTISTSQKQSTLPTNVDVQKRFEFLLQASPMPHSVLRASAGKKSAAEGNSTASIQTPSLASMDEDGGAPSSAITEPRRSSRKKASSNISAPPISPPQTPRDSNVPSSSLLLSPSSLRSPGSSPLKHRSTGQSKASKSCSGSDSTQKLGRSRNNISSGNKYRSALANNVETTRATPTREKTMQKKATPKETTSKEATPAVGEDSDLEVTRTRSGRRTMPVLDWWRNQHISVLSDGTTELNMGSSDVPVWASPVGVKGLKNSKHSAKKVSQSSLSAGKLSHRKAGNESDKQSLPGEGKHAVSLRGDLTDAKDVCMTGNSSSSSDSLASAKSSASSVLGRLLAGKAGARSAKRTKKATSKQSLKQAAEKSTTRSQRSSKKSNGKVTKVKAVAVAADDNNKAITRTDEDWNDVELQQLRRAHVTVPPTQANFWEAIALRVSTKTSKQCHDKWMNICNQQQQQRHTQAHDQSSSSTTSNAPKPSPQASELPTSAATSSQNVNTNNTKPTRRLTKRQLALLHATAPNTDDLFAEEMMIEASWSGGNSRPLLASMDAAKEAAKSSIPAPRKSGRRVPLLSSVSEHTGGTSESTGRGVEDEISYSKREKDGSAPIADQPNQKQLQVMKRRMNRALKGTAPALKKRRVPAALTSKQVMAAKLQKRPLKFGSSNLEGGPDDVDEDELEPELEGMPIPAGPPNTCGDETDDEEVF